MPLAPAFDCIAWRKFLTAVLVEQGIADDYISPFGFEVTGDVSYLSRTLRRFYVYVTSANNALPHKTEADAVNAILHSSLVNTPPFLADINLVVTSTQTLPLRRSGEAILYVKALPKVAETMVDAYAQYMAAAPALIDDRRLLEIARFHTSSSSRRYVFQLTVASSSVYGNLSALNQPQLQFLSSLMRACRDRDLITGMAPLIPASREEISALRKIVLPLHHAWASHLESSPDTRPVRIVEFTSGMTHELPLSKSSFSRAAAFIADSYRSYPNCNKE